MLASVLSAHRRSAALIGTLIVLVLPGGSLLVGGLWLYRRFRGARLVPSAVRYQRTLRTSTFIRRLR